MKSERLAFHRAMADSPEDVTPAFAYSDWLEEHGETDRAEFVRLQALAFRRMREFPGLAPHAWRERELIARNWSNWRLDWPAIEGGSWGEFENALPLPLLGSHCDLITTFQRLWNDFGIRRIRLTVPRSPLCEELAKWKNLRFFHTLEFTGAAIPHELHLLLGSPGLIGLHSLRIVGVPLSDLEIDALIDSPYLRNLERLELIETQINAEAVDRIVHVFTALRELRLDRNPIGDQGMRSICRTDALPELRSLDLEGCQLSPKAMVMLSESGRMSRLTGLRLEGNAISSEGVLALRGRSELRSLDLANTLLTDEGIRHLAEWEGLSSLEQLWIDRNRPIASEAFGRFFHAPQLQSLTMINLGGRTIDDEGMHKLIKSPLLSHLEMLILGRSVASIESSVVALAASPNSKALRCLTLSECGLSDRVAEAIASSPHLGELRELNLAHNLIGIGGQRMILQSPNLQALNYLDVGSGFTVDSELNESLGKRSAWFRLGELMNRIPLCRRYEV